MLLPNLTPPWSKRKIITCNNAATLATSSGLPHFSLKVPARHHYMILRPRQQSQPIVSLHFSASTTAKQVVDAYKAGLKFKDYIAVSLKNTESPEHTIIRNQLSSGNTICGGSDAVTKPTHCDGVISFAKSACEDVHLYHQILLTGI